MLVEAELVADLVVVRVAMVVVAIEVRIVEGTGSIVGNHIVVDADKAVETIEVVVGKHSSVQECHIVDAVYAVVMICCLIDIEATAAFALVDRP